MGQLLEFGFFHADPHPGNMMRTTDGKLAILDFGLMTEVTDNQKYGMIEAIAHLLNRDYSEIGQDFVNLDFIPEGTDTRPIVPALTKVFDVALAGGGAKSINFQELAADLAEITYEFPFQIPPYFALVIRAISVLEGIALVGNPDFAIIDEAYPYIARRLMTDDSPRLRAALRYMVYGREGSFNAEKLIDLLQALEKFTAIKDEGDGSAFKVDGVRGARTLGRRGILSGRSRWTSPIATRTWAAANSGSAATAAEASSHSRRTGAMTGARTTRRLYERPFAFSSFPRAPCSGSSCEEIVTVVDASSREAAQELVRTLGLGNLPVPGFVRALNPSLSEEDKTTVQQIRKLVQFLSGDIEGALAPEGKENARRGLVGIQRAQQLVNGDNSERLRNLIPVVREYSPQLREYGTLLVARLSEKAISRGLNWAIGAQPAMAR